MRKNILIYAIAFLNVLVAQKGICQPIGEKTNPVNEIINDVKMVAAKIDSFKADVEMSILKNNAPMIGKGKLLFKRPKNSRMELELYMSQNWGEGMKQEQIMVTNGSFLWQYIPQARMAAKLYLTEQSSPPTGIEVIEPFASVELDSLKLVGQDELKGKKCYLLEGKTKRAESLSGRPLVKLWIDTSNNLLLQIKRYNSPENNTNILTFFNIEINKIIDDTEFNFSPPAGTQIKEIKG